MLLCRFYFLFFYNLRTASEIFCDQRKRVNKESKSNEFVCRMEDFKITKRARHSNSSFTMNVDCVLSPSILCFPSKMIPMNRRSFCETFPFDIHFPRSSVYLPVVIMLKSVFDLFN